MNIHSLSVKELNNKLNKKEISCKEIVESFLSRIEKVEPKVKAFLYTNGDRARKKAEEVDKKISSGAKLKPLEGIPIAIKDNMCTEGMPTTCASKILSDFKPPYSADVINRIEATGMIIIGKTNMDEFAMGSSTENSAYGATRNPWDPERAPGGSSGGSAAAVAADEAPLALGSDTGGSIRQPASFCGVVGLKPTYGRVSRYGLIAFASSLDQIGPITREVYDSALLFQAIAGHDPKDSTSAGLSVPEITDFLKKDIKGLRLGIPREYFNPEMDSEVKNKISEAIKKLTDLGAVVKEISLPHTEYAVSVYYIIATAEASANLARYDGVRYGSRANKAENLFQMYSLTRGEGFGTEVKRRIMLGTYALSAGYYDAYYLKAQKVRTLIKNDFDEAFKACDAIITPTAPTPAFKLGEKSTNPLEMYLSDIFTISVNLAGIPGISIPCGFSKGNLPIGLQILGRPFDEGTILQIAYNFEQATGYHLRKTNI
ncbi:MAG: Asp-tRNA(Asn)/Glu-tRNA(Gln) amidotransferase subunit GatA [bacterium]|nr:Asp-tRNA(Asn)/Glu-tRNA(Gln) amidotransferase subunit GatA [bacterium]